MIKTITKQDVQVSDNCNDCGSFVDIGTVIDEQDTQLILQIDGDDSASVAEELINTAKARFDNVKATTKASEQHILLFLDFSFTVEKMIFQLENSL
ncbi:DUF406 family protein [Shewanella donghaensis]|uniref:DUF406 family protein n=1 Tax=Shewanella donghaensis TaxID=238836 RepID=UPI0011827E4F|nr:DUF406 family protein [Shewanella donghaensis]